jgi:hypothetical protein
MEDGVGKGNRPTAIRDGRQPDRLLAANRGIGIGDELVDAVEPALRMPRWHNGVTRGVRRKAERLSGHDDRMVLAPHPERAGMFLGEGGRTG